MILLKRAYSLSLPQNHIAVFFRSFLAKNHFPFQEQDYLLVKGYTTIFDARRCTIFTNSYSIKEGKISHIRQLGSTIMIPIMRVLKLPWKNIFFIGSSKSMGRKSCIEFTQEPWKYTKIWWIVNRISVKVMHT